MQHYGKIQKDLPQSTDLHMPKVTTPVLILHNDEDGAAVYQGIEYLAALRRLGKLALALKL
ncbi:MAG: hypothetical protein IPJ39_18505 [Saprospiraceae bacterium]|nr:hypothetical protein [Saprospiraceae bacterium]